MTRIGLFSDTHGHLDPKVMLHFADCQQIWHAGDIGSGEILTQLEAKSIIGVHGNIDGEEVRVKYPLEQLIHCEGFIIWMIHIGGYPGHYAPGIKKRMEQIKPDLLICGHSHILKIIRDKEIGVLVINPGATGRHGFHKVRTLVKFDLHQKKIENMQVIELGLRSTPL